MEVVVAGRGSDSYTVSRCRRRRSSSSSSSSSSCSSSRDLKQGRQRRQ